MAKTKPLTGSPNEAASWALACLPLLFLLAFLIAPALRLLAEAAALGSSEAPWLAPLHDPYLRWRLLWSGLQASITCGLVLVLGLPMAWVLARLEFAGRRWLLRACACWG